MLTSLIRLSTREILHRVDTYGSVNNSVHMTRWRRRLSASMARNQRQIVDYAAVIAYDGRAFAGYARQPHQLTVEGLLRDALATHIKGFRRLVVAGRTDKGVSAIAQVVSFRGDSFQRIDTIYSRLNALAPHAFWCRSLQHAPYGFHAQFWATRRRYCYLHPATPEELRRSSIINAQLQALEGTRCMFSFSRQIPPQVNTTRRVFRARCYPAHVDHTPVLTFEIEAQGFLRQMVRVLVSTAIKRGHPSEPTTILRTIAAEHNRHLTEEPAPPEPLRFVSAHYAPWSPLVCR